jgi:acyl carrier protein|tara:strand:- start:1215 stop:1457 length:243 start_codon:yes stop_codon:yes gene_type:complete
MNDEHINRKLSKIFNDILSVKEFKLSLTMDKIEEWDSLKHIQLLLAIDDAFGIEIQFEDAIEMISGKSILNKIKKYIDDE